MKKNVLRILFLLLTLVACSKKADNAELKYTALEFTALSHEASLSNEKGEDGIKFSDYAPGVNRLESKGLIYKQLSFFTISFESAEQARSEAVRLNQYYARNWLFDRVEGEPILEDYVIETFKAVNPNRRVQRIPKKHAEEGSEIHENAPTAHH